MSNFCVKNPGAIDVAPWNVTSLGLLILDTVPLHYSNLVRYSEPTGSSLKIDKNAKDPNMFLSDMRGS